MKLIVTNIGSIERAELELGQITLLVGLNSAGKSTLLQCLAAALTGDATFGVAGLKKSDLGAAVRIGAAKGQIVLKGDQGSVTIDYPNGTVTNAGRPPGASGIATGVTPVTLIPRAQRSDVISRFIKADPTEEDLVAALRAIGLDNDQTATVVKSVKEKGFDGFYTEISDYGVKLKGQWEQVTGVNFGTVASGKYIPNGWDSGLRDASQASLQASVTAANQNLEDLIAARAVDADEIDRLTTEAARRALVGEQELKDNEDVLVWQERVKNAEAKLGILPAAVQPKANKCPHCDELLDISVLASGSFKVGKSGADLLTDEELLRRRTDLTKANTDLSTANQELDLAQGKLAMTRARLASTVEAGDKLQAYAARVGGRIATEADVDSARESKRTAEQRLGAFNLKTDADKKYNSAMMCEALKGILDPNGLRRTALVKALENFTASYVNTLAAHANWHNVEISPEMIFAYAGRTLLNAKNEKWRLEALLRVSLAILEQAPVVLLDEADILDKDGRNGLFAMLPAARIPVVVAMTMSQDANVPNLAQYGMGRTYVVENGTVKALG